MNILIPMAGDGKRFFDAGYKVPKPLIDVNGKTMIEVAVESFGLEGQFLFVTREYENHEFNSRLNDVLKSCSKNPIIKSISYLTEGAAQTCLLMADHIDNGEPLIVTNCDQIMKWDSPAFAKFLRSDEFDGAVVTYPKITEKNSYVALNDNGDAVEFAEKKIISNHSLNGIHYWKRGSDFVRSAKSMIAKNLRINNEFYIAPTYNELIQEGKRIVIYEIPIEQHFATGTPDDLNYYLTKFTI